MKKALSLLIILLLVFSACGDSRPEETGAADNSPAPVRTLLGRYLGPTYSVHTGNDPDGEKIIFDCEGGIVTGDYEARAVTDAFTGEPRFYVVKTASGSTLYNSRGRLVRETAACEYGENGIGSSVIIHETENEFELPYKLWDVEKDEMTLANVAALYRLSEDRVLAVDGNALIMGVFGPGGEKLIGFPMEQKLWLEDAADGRYLAVNTPVNEQTDDYIYTTELDEDGNEITVISAPEDGEAVFDDEDDEEFVADTAYIFDKDAKLLLEADYESDIRFARHVLFGDYYLRSEGIGDSVCKISDGKPIFSAEEILYYDGVNAVIRSEEMSAALTDAGGVSLFTGCDVIIPCGQGDSAEMAFVSKVGKKLMVLGRDGKVTAESQIEGLTGFSLAGEYVIYEVASGEETLAGIADLSLNTILPPEKYNSVTLFEAAANVYFAGAYVNRFGFLRIDILDKNGAAAAENLTDAVSIDGSRFAACRYTRAGIMDFEGNWIKDYYIPDVK
ncbi:MAG: hypothetical protein IJU01_04160 [Lachnospiraceae bacterium]|nr:hypothetical protein [Lachnospiraceae bacterium]